MPAYRTFISLLWIRGHCLRPKRLPHSGNPEKRPTVLGRRSPTSGLSTLAVLVVLPVITDRIGSIGRARGPGLSGGHVPTPSQASSSPLSSLADDIVPRARSIYRKRSFPHFILMTRPSSLPSLPLPFLPLLRPSRSEILSFPPPPRGEPPSLPPSPLHGPPRCLPVRAPPRLACC